MKKQPVLSRSVKASVLAATLFCLPLLTPVVGQAMEINAIQDIKPMTKAQLAKYRGGFKIGAYEFAMGVDIKGWVDGVLKTSTNITVGDLAGALAGNPKVQIAPSVGDGDVSPDSVSGTNTFAANGLGTIVQVNTPEELENVLNANGGLLNTLITNTRDGVKIDQTTNMTVVVSNYNEIHTPAANSLPNLLPQLANTGFVGLR
jgi:hypothetical protein